MYAEAVSSVCNSPHILGRCFPGSLYWASSILLMLYGMILVTRDLIAICQLNPSRLRNCSAARVDVTHPGPAKYIKGGRNVDCR